MRLLARAHVWIEAALRARRYAHAARPSHPAPGWIRAAESFSLLEANPLASIRAGKISWLEQAGEASRLLSRYALELQQAADSLEGTRASLAIADHQAPGSANGAFRDPSQFGAIERQRRALSLEREGLCLLAAALRARYEWPEAATAERAAVDKPQHLLGGLTLLAYFVSIRRLDAVERLLDASAHPGALCMDGSDALIIASRKAEAYAGAPACGAAIQASCILSLLEARALMEATLPAPSRPTGRI